MVEPLRRFQNTSEIVSSCYSAVCEIATASLSISTQSAAVQISYRSGPCWQRHVCWLADPDQDQDAKSDGSWGDIAPKSQGNNGGWADMACFMDLSRWCVNATAGDVVGRAGKASQDGKPEVLVFQESMGVAENVHRTRVFKSSDGKCNPQAGTLCKHVEGGAAAAPVAHEAGAMMQEVMSVIADRTGYDVADFGL